MARFEKGVSGNPRGRPKGRSNKIPSDKSILEDFKRCNTTALNKLLSILEGPDEALATKAAIKILDINYNIAIQESKDKDKAKSATGVSLEDTKPKAKVLTLTKN